MSDTSQSKENLEYSNFVERLKNEIGVFFSMADGSRNRTGTLPLKTRQKSIEIRKLLKEFRKFSIDNELANKNIKKHIKDNRDI